MTAAQALRPVATMSRIVARQRTRASAAPAQTEGRSGTTLVNSRAGCQSSCWSDETVTFVAGPPSESQRAFSYDFGPFVNDDVCLLWDGRLDNRLELSGALNMSHATDAELIVAAYRRWGDDCVEHLIGDWALVIWDLARKRLFAAKDPLGWRPFYYAALPGEMVFASEYQDLWRLGVKPQVNEDFLYRYLADATQQPGQTAYRDVFMLHGGQFLVSTHTGHQVGTYWDAPRVSPRNYKHPMDYVEEFDELVSGAVASMISDKKPTAVFLSGGLDSSYIAAVAADINVDTRAISSYAPGTAWDERVHQHSVLAHTGIAGTSVCVSHCTALNPAIAPASMFDIPATPPQHALLAYMGQSASREGFEVILSGVGGDEWLTGDPRFAADALFRGHPRKAVELARRHGAGPNVARKLARSTYRAISTPRVQSWIGKARGNPHWDGLLPFVQAHEGWKGRVGREMTPLFWPEHLRRRTWRAYRNDAQGTIEWMDRQCHRPNHIEFRSPLNDLRVIEFLASVPEWMKRFEGRPKDILRAAMKQRGMPASLYGRTDKASYDEPYESGLRFENRARVEAAIAAVCQLPEVDAAAVRRETSKWLDDPTNAWEPTWRVVSAGLWLHFINTLSPAEVMPSGELTLSPRTLCAGDRSPQERGKEEQ